MKNKIISFTSLVALALSFCAISPVFAEEETDITSEANSETSTTDENVTSIGITPLSKVLSLSSSSVYDDVFTVSNNGDNVMNIETYASPYSYVYSESSDSYSLGFNNENSFTQISRWITFQDQSGNYVQKANYTIAPNSSLDISYRITTPESIPAGGQYAVIFAHTLSSSTITNGIKTEASPGIIVYGRSSEGETIVSSEISDLAINQTYTDETSGDTRNLFNATAKVKNNGNVDFTAAGILKVEKILFGGVYYETDATSGRVSVIPESELSVSDKWEGTPDFGLFKVTWTVSAGDNSESIERVIFLISPVAIISFIILLTFAIVGIIILIKKRKENRSRYAI